MDRRFRALPENEIKNIPLKEVLNRIAEKYFLDKSMDYLLGFWFTLRVIEAKATNYFLLKDNLSEKEHRYFSEFVSAFVLFGYKVCELVKKCEVKNKKVNFFSSWFLYFFFGMYSPIREKITFYTIMHTGIPFETKNNKDFFDEEGLAKEADRITKVLKKEPSDFLRGMEYAFDFIDKFFLVLPKEICEHILNQFHLKTEIDLLKILIDEILQKRARMRFSFPDQTLVASIGMIDYLNHGYDSLGLKRGYENTVKI